jgi:hypothetical protein
VFLFTGETGEQYGYSDGWRPDGIFAYTGEGQRGDMEFVRGNRAIRDHLEDGRDLLLFEATKTKGNYRFRGCFGCAGWETRKAPDKDGTLRDATIFHLVPISEIETETAEPPESPDKDRTKTLEELRLNALAATKAPQVLTDALGRYSRSSSGRQMRRNCPLSPFHANISLSHKTHLAGRVSLEGPLVSITS